MSRDVALYATAAFALGACAGAAACLYHAQRLYAQPELASRPQPDAAAAAAATPLSLEDEIVREQLSRNVTFFGEPAQRVICSSFVVVVGLGGVGSHAAHMLLRGGVGRLRLIDFDQVTLSSLNRHAVATRADVGTPKVCPAPARSA